MIERISIREHRETDRFRGGLSKASEILEAKLNLSAPRSFKGPLRVDARRNRDLVFAAAKLCFAEDGSKASMEDIARRAGVGVGTLYRAFGNRSGLAEAVFRDMLGELAEAATQLTQEDEPWDALEAWLKSYLGQLMSKRAMIGELQPLFDQNPSLLPDSRLIAAQALEVVLEPVRTLGLVRGDLAAEDLMQLVNGMITPGLISADRADFLLEIVLSGIRIPVGRELGG